MTQAEQTFDSIIIGAGPAGTSCALSLAGRGLKVAVIDRATFPRDKICGDALSADAINQLSKLSDELPLKFSNVASKLPSAGVRICAPDLTQVDIPFVDKDRQASGYVCARELFDDMLFQEVKSNRDLAVYEGCSVESLRSFRDAIEVVTSQGVLKGRLIVGADGSGSIVRRMKRRKAVDRRHHSAGLRAYYENVSGFNEKNYVELYFFKSILPGYVWVFPMADNRANVGIGVLSSVVSKKRINLREELHNFLTTHPLLAGRFATARAIEKGRGHGLPLGSGRERISGERLLLVGDAASLIDPFTGEGIGNAIRSGRLAAAHAVRCFAANDFSARFNRVYDQEIHRKIGKELRISHLLQQLSKYPWLFNRVIRKAKGSIYWHQFLTQALADINVKMKFADPRFYYRLLIG